MIPLLWSNICLYSRGDYHEFFNSCFDSVLVHAHYYCDLCMSVHDCVYVLTFSPCIEEEGRVRERERGRLRESVCMCVCVCMRGLCSFVVIKGVGSV